MAILRQRCRNHPEREAAARCGSCGRDFCRECVIPYDGRLTCGACIKKLAGDAEKRRRPRALSAAMLVAGAGCGLVALWYSFYLLGLLLLKTPTIFYSNWLGS